MRYAYLSKEYLNVFTCKYDNLKTYNTSIIQHRISLKRDAKLEQKI